MFDVKQLRVLKAVADHGSFSAAADALSYTQPAISQQIAALEKRAGTTLVDRGSRGVRLTDAGRALVEHAEVVIARLAAAEAELEAIAGIRGGRVRLASFPTAGGRTEAPAVGNDASRTRPPRIPAIASSSASAAASRAITTSACSTSARPASVSRTPRLPRSTSVVPARFSSAAICCEMAGWV